MSAVVEEKKLDLDRILNRVTGEPRWLLPLRSHAFEAFRRLGWPTPKAEAWRFTNLRELSRLEFGLAEQEPAVEADMLKSYLLEEEHPYCLVFVNGDYRENLSRTEGLPSGVKLMPLRDAFREESELVQNHLTHYAAYENEGFTALNTAFMDTGLFLHVPKSVELDHPIQLLHVAVPEASPVLTNPRNLIILEANSKAAFTESFFAVEDGCYWVNAVTEAVLEPGAKLAHYFKEYHSEEAYHLSTVSVKQNRDSAFESHNILVGGALVRNKVHVDMDGIGADAEINGLYVGHKTQLLDNQIEINHNQPHCSSRQAFKGILDDKARGVFNGRIFVAKDAQKTDSSQSNRNLLLSGDARVNTKPELEIYADDVKCAHGATTGQIDEDAVFYLQSRGIDPKSAMDLITYAFAHEIVERIPLAGLRNQAEAFLFERFSKAKVIEEP